MNNATSYANGTGYVKMPKQIAEIYAEQIGRTI
jgi:hypothetical protein